MKTTYISFSGGGLLGYYEWCVYKELYKAGIRAKMFSGTSAGALCTFLAAKELFDVGDEAFKYVSEHNADSIFKTRTMEIRDGGLNINGKSTFDIISKGLNFFDLLKAVLPKGKEKFGKALFKNALNVFPLMTNEPLFDTLLKIQKAYPEFKTKGKITTVSLATGDLDIHDLDNFSTDEDLVRAIVSSTNIPILLPLVKRFVNKQGKEFLMNGDGGIREGTPVDAIFDTLPLEEDAEIIVISANERTLQRKENFVDVRDDAGRTMQIMMNELQLGDYKGIIKTNKFAELYGEKIGRKIVDLYILEYTGEHGSFSCSPEAFADMKASAEKDVAEFLKTYKKGV